MARAVTTNRKAINTAIAWGIGLLIFFPILWTILTSFKTEAQAINGVDTFAFDFRIKRGFDGSDAQRQKKAAITCRRLNA